MNLLKSVLFSKEEVNGGDLTAEETAKDKELEETKRGSGGFGHTGQE